MITVYFIQPTGGNPKIRTAWGKLADKLGGRADVTRSNIELDTDIPLNTTTHGKALLVSLGNRLSEDPNFNLVIDSTTLPKTAQSFGKYLDTRNRDVAKSQFHALALLNEEPVV